MIQLLFFLTNMLLVPSGTFEGEISNIDNTSLISPSDGKFKDYWYAGEAEVTSYKLSQARYGELREGTAALVFVTEPFSRKTNTKTDNPTNKSISVLKLNTTKKFNTGIYPYSMMSSTFYPVENGDHSFKVSSSVQEWCGHMYVELRNKSNYEIDLYSYFEGESMKGMQLEKVDLEDDIWSKIRLQPQDLPQGKVKMLPSFFYFRFSHTPIQPYEADIKVTDNPDGSRSCHIYYPEIERKLIINYEAGFPYRILGWEEAQKNGFGSNEKIMTTTATKINSIKTAYWKQNSNKYAYLRKELGLE